MNILMKEDKEGGGDCWKFMNSSNNECAAHT